MSNERWMDKEDVIHLYNGNICHKKWNWVICRDVDGSVIQNEVRKSKTSNLEKWYRWVYFQGSNREADVGNGCMDTVGGKGRETDWEIRIEICTLTCIKQIASGKLLQSAGSSARCSDDLEGWDAGGGWRGRRYKYTYSCFISLYNRNQNNIVKQ